MVGPRTNGAGITAGRKRVNENPVSWSGSHEPAIGSESGSGIPVRLWEKLACEMTGTALQFSEERSYKAKVYLYRIVTVYVPVTGHLGCRVRLLSVSFVVTLSYLRGATKSSFSFEWWNNVQKLVWQEWKFKICFCTKHSITKMCVQLLPRRMLVGWSRTKLAET